MISNENSERNSIGNSESSMEDVQRNIQKRSVEDFHGEYPNGIHEAIK